MSILPPECDHDDQIMKLTFELIGIKAYY